MGTIGHRDTILEDGVDKDAYVLAFTNGALHELEELQEKLELNNVEAVVKVAIAVLKQLQERDGKKEQHLTAVGR